VGTGGTQFIGTIPKDGQEISLTHDFVVNGTLASGIYSLPITLNYLRDDGTAGSDVLRASIVVVAPPQFQYTFTAPLPVQANAGEPLTLALTVLNVGERRVALTRSEVQAENGQVVEGGEAQQVALNPNEEATINAVIVPEVPGVLTITITLYYVNELRQPRILTEAYEVEIVAPPPPPIEETPPPGAIPTPTPAPVEDNLLQRLLLGFLGLGS
jgi:hypothetical protein